MKGVRLTDRGWFVLTLLCCTVAVLLTWFALPMVMPWADVRIR